MSGRGGKKTFDKALEDVRRQCAPRDREYRPDDSQQLLQENHLLKKRLSDRQKENRKLRAGLQYADEEIRRRDHDIRSLQRQLSALQAQMTEEVQLFQEEVLLRLQGVQSVTTGASTSTGLLGNPSFSVSSQADASSMASASFQPAATR